MQVVGTTKKFLDGVIMTARNLVIDYRPDTRLGPDWILSKFAR